MNRFRNWSPLVVVAALILDAAIGSGAGAREPSTRPAASGMPSDVMAFLRRKGACDRRMEEDNEDPDRLARTVNSRQQLKCQLIDDEERRLRARYGDRPDVMDLIERGDD